MSISHDLFIAYLSHNVLSPFISLQVLKSKINFGLSLSRKEIKDNNDRNIPVEIVEARKYVQYLDDEF